MRATTPSWSDPVVNLDVAYVPTPKDLVRKMLRVAGVRRGETVFDLGAGDGRILIEAVRGFGARAIGVEMDPERLGPNTRTINRDGHRGNSACRRFDAGRPVLCRRGHDLPFRIGERQAGRKAEERTQTWGANNFPRLRPPGMGLGTRLDRRERWYHTQIILVQGLMIRLRYTRNYTARRKQQNQPLLTPKNTPPLGVPPTVRAPLNPKILMLVPRAGVS